MAIRPIQFPVPSTELTTDPVRRQLRHDRVGESFDPGSPATIEDGIAMSPGTVEQAACRLQIHSGMQPRMRRDRQFVCTVADDSVDGVTARHTLCHGRSALRPDEVVADSHRPGDHSMLEQQPESLHLILESLPTGTIVVDRAGHIVRVNQQVERWFGYDRGDLLGQPVEVLIPDRFRKTHPGMRDEYFAAPRVRPMGVNRDLFARRKDGTEFPVDVSLHPLPLANGVQVLVHMVDSTLRRELEARQRHEESLRRMQFMVENLPAGAVYVSIDEGTLLVNRTFEKMTGYSAADLRGFEAALDLLFRDRAMAMRAQIECDRTAGFAVPREFQITRRDGTAAWVEVAVYRYNNHEVWLWHDITDRQAAQDRLLQSARLAAIGEMMTGLAHESRNALQRARAALEMLDLDLEDKPLLRGLSQRAVSALDELQRLYEEVRSYAAPIHLEERDVDLPELWHEVWSQLQQVHPKTSASLTSRCSESARVARLDRHRVRQVFRNILENAIAVIPESDGRIEITAGSVNADGRQWIEVSFQDNGPGMTSEQTSQIFEPFYTTKSRGTGLGMAIVRRIMEAHGGSAFVAPSEKGACIVVRFPGR